MTAKAVIEIYTDGSATTANLPGGWAFRIVGNGTPIFESSGYMEKASNNDAELEAALQGLEYIKAKYELAKRDPKLEEIYLVSDSQIVLGWASGKYKAKQAEKVHKIQRLKQLISEMAVKTKWVKGHHQDVHNIRCDRLAKNARKGKTVAIVPKDDRLKVLTAIGTKRKGIVAIWYKNMLKIIDLDSNLIENYDPDLHGQRASQLEIQPGDK